MCVHYCIIAYRYYLVKCCRSTVQKFGTRIAVCLVYSQLYCIVLFMREAQKVDYEIQYRTVCTV